MLDEVTLSPVGLPYGVPDRHTPASPGSTPLPTKAGTVLLAVFERGRPLVAAVFAGRSLWVSGLFGPLGLESARPIEGDRIRWEQTREGGPRSRLSTLLPLLWRAGKVGKAVQRRELVSVGRPLNVLAVVDEDELV